MGLVKKSVIIVLLGVGFYFLRQYLNGPMCESEARLDGKVVIVTGANSGKIQLIIRLSFYFVTLLRILDIHGFISDMVLLHAKNKAVSLKVANTCQYPKNVNFWLILGSSISSILKNITGDLKR